MSDTYLHRLNVATKLFIFLCVIIAVFLFSHPLANLCLFVFLLAVILPARINLKSMFQTLSGMKLLFILIVLFSIFTGQTSRWTVL